MDIKVGRNWGLFAAGIALVIIGFVLLMVPGLTLVSIAVIAGCMFLAAGIVDAYAATTPTNTCRPTSSTTRRRPAA